MTIAWSTLLKYWSAVLFVLSVMQCLSMYKPAKACNLLRLLLPATCGSHNAFYLVHRASLHVNNEQGRVDCSPAGNLTMAVLKYLLYM